MVTAKEIYEALKTVKLIDLNKTRKDTEKLNKRKNRKTKHKALNMTRDNVSSLRGKKISGIFGKIANPTSNWKPVDSKLTRTYPKVHKLLFKYIKENAPKGFKFDSITINHNLKCKKHVDRKNAPVSFITAVGDFTGGELVIEDPKTKKTTTYVTKNKFLMYDGKTWRHWNNKINGDKYTVVAYNRHGKDRHEKKETFEPYYVK